MVYDSFFPCVHLYNLKIFLLFFFVLYERTTMPDLALFFQSKTLVIVGGSLGEGSKDKEFLSRAVATIFKVG